MVAASGSELQLNIVGCANGQAGRQLGCEEAASVIKNSTFLKAVPFDIRWRCTVEEEPCGRQLAAMPSVSKTCTELAAETSKLVSEQKPLLVIGGDHSCAIGTWSGVASALRESGDMGLIWIDAHMDAHTPDSSDTGNIHGMPSAHLLGHGAKNLREIGDKLPKVLPQNIAYIGIRSYEPPEQKLLDDLGARVFFIEEVEKRGIHAVLTEAIEIATRNTVGFGFSIDIDGFRVKDAPAVGTPEKGGVIAADFMRSMKEQNLTKLVATEIVEFLPKFDDAEKTSERLVVDLMQSIFQRKFEQLGMEPRNGVHQG